MRVVLNTNILVRAYPETAGPARELLHRIASSPHTLVISMGILDEVELTLGKDYLQARWSSSPAQRQRFRRSLEQVGEVVAPLGGPRIVADEDDDVVIYTAIEGKADAICTLDRHFLQPNVVRFCSERRIEITTDVDLLQRLRQLNG